MYRFVLLPVFSVQLVRCAALAVPPQQAERAGEGLLELASPAQPSINAEDIFSEAVLLCILLFI